MKAKIKVALLYGGKSGEHEVSLRSAFSILQNLYNEYYDIIPIGIDKAGYFYINDYIELKQCKDFLPVKASKSIDLPSLFNNAKFAIDADVVFPITHGPLYEDGCLQGLLELAGIAYVGSGVLASAMGMDKDIARQIVCHEDIYCAKYQTIPTNTKLDAIEKTCDDFIQAVGFPIFVKPCSMGSSVGINKVYDKKTLLEAIAVASEYDEYILLEECIVGREIELAVLENIDDILNPKVSLAGEICIANKEGFYSYDAKYVDEAAVELIAPVHLEESLLSRLQGAAGKIFYKLRCKGMARVDFFVDNKEKIYFSEINTLPGFTSISMYPKLWQASGLKYKDLLAQLIDLAITNKQRRNFKTQYL